MLIHADVIHGLDQIESDSIDLVATSIPYNIGVDYDNWDDCVPWPQYYAWMGAVIAQCYRVLRKGGTIAVNCPMTVRYQHDHPHAASWQDYDPDWKGHRGSEKLKGHGRIEMIGHNIWNLMRSNDSHMREPVVWVKSASEQHEPFATSGRTGSDSNPFFRPTHEMIYLGSKGQWHHRGGTGRRGSLALPYKDWLKDTWYAGGRSHSKHPAIWPIEIPHRLIRIFCHANDCVVLDPFCGTGTTLKAAQLLGHDFVGIDNSQLYIDIARENTSQLALGI